MESFVYQSAPSRVVFGQGALAQLPDEVVRLVTLPLPADVSAASGMNAMAHAVEALYAQDANLIISLMAEESTIRRRSSARPSLRCWAVPGAAGCRPDGGSAKASGKPPVLPG